MQVMVLQNTNPMIGTCGTLSWQLVEVTFMHCHIFTFTFMLFFDKIQLFTRFTWKRYTTVDAGEPPPDHNVERPLQLQLEGLLLRHWAHP